MSSLGTQSKSFKKATIYRFQSPTVILGNNSLPTYSHLWGCNTGITKSTQLPSIKRNTTKDSVLYQIQERRLPLVQPELKFAEVDEERKENSRGSTAETEEGLRLTRSANSFKLREFNDSISGIKTGQVIQRDMLRPNLKDGDKKCETSVQCDILPSNLNMMFTQEQISQKEDNGDQSSFREILADDGDRDVTQPVTQVTVTTKSANLESKCSKTTLISNNSESKDTGFCSGKNSKIENEGVKPDIFRSRKLKFKNKLMSATNSNKANNLNFLGCGRRPKSSSKVYNFKCKEASWFKSDKPGPKQQFQTTGKSILHQSLPRVLRVGNRSLETYEECSHSYHEMYLDAEKFEHIVQWVNNVEETQAREGRCTEVIDKVEKDWLQ